MADTPPRPDDDAPRDPSGDAPGGRVPNPHAGEVPPAAADEGLRPEAEGTPARPTGDEPLGPYGELIPAVGVEAKEEATPGGDPEAESLLAQMGVEEEGIEGGQILGLILSVMVAVVAMIVILIYLFIIPTQVAEGEDAEDVDEYVELEQVRVEGLAKLQSYERADSAAYAVPIGRAMGLVAAEYGATRAGAANVPTTRQDWNTLPISVGPPRAVQVPASRGALTAPVPEAGVETAPLNPTGAPNAVQEARPAPLRVPAETGEDVGVDEGDEAFDDID